MAPPDDPLLADLTTEQQEAVTTRASPLCILAGAGSGKTRVLTRRIAWQIRNVPIDPRRVLALTFTRRAAGELRGRLRRLGLRDPVRAGTFHAAALAQLHRYAVDRGRRPPEILTNRAAFLARLRPDRSRKAIAEASAEIDWARARMVSPEKYAEAAASHKRLTGRRAAEVADLYAEYEAAKRRRRPRLFDFEDLLSGCRSLMEKQPNEATAQRWRNQHLLVDELQDVNRLQFALLRSWLGPESTLTVVGDGDQAIYGWNGADPRLIGEVDRYLPGCAVLHLNTNFRSTPEILEVAGRVLGRPPQPAVRVCGPDPTVTECSGADEAATLVRSVRSCHKPGAPWQHQAVLARTNAQLAPLQQALERQGIAVITLATSDLLQRPGVRDLLDSWEPDADLHATVIDARVERDDRAAEDSEGLLGVGALLDLAEEHLCLDPGATVRSFTVSLKADSRSRALDDGVELATFHAAKGLEWPIVHLVGIEDGLVPIAHARTAEARAEERRLLYVAVTRARQELHVLWCSSRYSGDRVRDRRPSPWIADIEPVASTSASARAIGGGEVAEIIAETRRLLGDRPDPNRIQDGSAALSISPPGG